MRKKNWVVVFMLLLLSSCILGCGEKTSEVSNESLNSTNQQECATEEVSQEESVVQAEHVHNYVYIANNDGTHSINCEDDACDFSDTENCDYSSEYQCTKCNYKHEHEIAVTPGNDGTHQLSCSGCDYLDNELCILNDEYICEKCEWVHEHEETLSANDDGTHTISCSYECCNYTSQENCVYEHYECLACGHIFSWEQDIEYFDGVYDWKGIYYAQKDLNIYKHPDTESEIVGTLRTNEGVNCVGRVVKKEGKKVQIYWITEDGNCILNEYHNKTKRYDLREGTTTQVVVKYMTLSGDTWSRLKMHKTYDSYDAALQDLCGSTWTYIKSNWKYNDYDSQGLAFMNTYSEGASGMTVATDNLVDPYNYSCGENITYYFY